MARRRLEREVEKREKDGENEGDGVRGEKERVTRGEGERGR